MDRSYEKVQQINSCAKGMTASYTSDFALSDAIKISGNLDPSVLSFLNVYFGTSLDNTVPKYFAKKFKHVGPPETSPYNSRSYFSTVEYNEGSGTIHPNTPGGKKKMQNFNFKNIVHITIWSKDLLIEG